MENWCHPILAQHIYGEMLSHIRLSLSWFILHCTPETKSPYPQQLTSNRRSRIRRREDTGVAIGADDHGVGAFSTNFLLSSLKPSVRVLLRTLKPGVRVCINQNETKVFVTLATTIYITYGSSSCLPQDISSYHITDVRRACVICYRYQTTHSSLYMLVCIFAAWLHPTCGASWNTTVRVLKFIDIILNAVNTVADTPSHPLDPSCPMASDHSFLLQRDVRTAIRALSIPCLLLRDHD